MEEKRPDPFMTYLKKCGMNAEESPEALRDPDRIFLTMDLGGARVQFGIPLGGDVHELVKESQRLGCFSGLDSEVEFCASLREHFKYHHNPDTEVPVTNLMLAVWMTHYHKLQSMVAKPCECGAEKANTTHTDWCPKHIT